MNFESFKNYFEDVKETSEGQFLAKCPGHDDKRASLSINNQDKEKILIYCHAGCSTEKVLNSISLSVSDLYKSTTTKKLEKPRVVAQYVYEDEHGEVCYIVNRTEPKGFFQQSKDSDGKWVNGIKGKTPMLYKLPQLITAVSEKKMIFIVEGEKDADNLISKGLIATTSPMGAGKWRESFNPYFGGAEVVIIPDNDNIGRKHAETIAENIYSFTNTVKIINLDGLNEKQDVSDWLVQGNSIEQLLGICNKAETWKQSSLEESVVTRAKVESFHLTDLGNAKRFVNHYGDKLRFCVDNKKWLIWDGTTWNWDSTFEVLRLAKSTVERIIDDIFDPLCTYHKSDIEEWARNSETGHKIRELVKLAESEDGIPIKLSDLDADQWLLNCKNGTINLKTGELQSHSKEDMITRLAPVSYNKDAASLAFENFIETILPGIELRKFVQRAAGYSMTGDTGEEKLFFAYGPAATGKSTFINTISKVLGDYAATADFESFVSKQGNSGPRNDIARLVGKRFVMGSEVENGKKLAEGLVKQLTGGDTVTARFLHQEFFEFKPNFKLWLAANHQPKIDAEDVGMWRRILQIPFIVQIPPEKRDPELKKQLQDLDKSGSAILNWLIKGCLAWQNHGLGVPKEVEESTNSYRENMDTLKDFLEDCCIVNPLARIDNTELWAAYTEWCDENGERGKLGRKTFKSKLESKGIRQERDSRSRYWVGLKLIYESDKKEIPATIQGKRSVF
ncbi:MAG: phage/plasmid primase, family [Anaerocolumna sp.]|jgi:putative DNA primase/helicase|nr:phage/plasmid primase, family [Anaerocolumna sp.]